MSLPDAPATLTLGALAAAVDNNIVPSSLKLAEIVDFVKFATLTRPYLKHPTPPTSSTGPPSALPVPIVNLLCGIMGWEESATLAAWELLKWDVWESPEGAISEMELMRFNKYALPEGTSFKHVFPGFQACLVTTCRKPLTFPLTYKATLHTLRYGALPIYTTSLYCRRCHIRYHHNYSIGENATMRTYYGGVPEIIQVSQHFFMEASLLELITVGQVFAWVSATNWSRIYNTALTDPQAYVQNNPRAFMSTAARRPAYERPNNWQTTFSLRPEDVLNGFFLYSLLLDKAETDTLLSLPHQAKTHEKRLQGVLELRNQAMEGIGQEMYPHACDLCFHVLTDSNGESIKLQAAVCDGITIGHPCCAVHDCKIPLQSHTDTFCPAHQNQKAICAVRDCDSPCEAKFRTCSLEAHRRAETNYYAKGTAMFQLRARLKKAGFSVPEDSLATAPLDFQDSEDVREDLNADIVACDEKSLHTKVKGSFAHNFTSTELLFMRPCGIILSRATLFGSESVSAVHLAAKATFPSEDSTPEYLFYDSNCRLVAHQRAIGDTHFAHTGQPVDVFHFNSKHKETDLDCQRHCNPASFPELMIDGKWRFNSSICEQTNAWLGGFRSILRNMEVTRFNFYLDEMIKRRNRFVLQELERKSHNPWTVPFTALFPSIGSSDNTPVVE